MADTIVTARAQTYVSAAATNYHARCALCLDCDVPTVLGMCGQCYGSQFPGLFS